MEPALQIADNRTGATEQKNLQELVVKSPQTLQAAQLHAISNAPSSKVTQRKGTTADPLPATHVPGDIVQRAFSPQDADWTEAISAKVFTGGLQNKGIIILSNNAGRKLVAKFTDEDPRRAAFADKVLGAAGVESTNTNAVPMNAGGTDILDQVTALANTLRATDPGEATALDNAVLKARGAAFVAVMDWVSGEEMGDIALGGAYSRGEQVGRNPKEQAKFAKIGRTFDFTAMVDPALLNGLGRLAAANALLGNSDSLSALSRKNSWGLLKQDNIKVTAQGAVAGIDNDTELISRQALSAAGHDLNPEAWAEFLIGGSFIASAVPGGRHTQGIDTLFSSDKQDLMLQQIYEIVVMSTGTTLKYDLYKPQALPYFQQGIADGLDGIRQNAVQLQQSITAIGGGDKGGGFMDPEALNIKLDYINQVGSENQVKAHALFRKWKPEMEARLQDLGSYTGVPGIAVRPENLSGKEKFTSAMSGSKLTADKKEAKEIKGKARAGAVTADDLNALKGTSHQVQKAKFLASVQLFKAALRDRKDKAEMLYYEIANIRNRAAAVGNDVVLHLARYQKDYFIAKRAAPVPFTARPLWVNQAATFQQHFALTPNEQKNLKTKDKAKLTLELQTHDADFFQLTNEITNAFQQLQLIVQAL